MERCPSCGRKVRENDRCPCQRKREERELKVDVHTYITKGLGFAYIPEMSG